MISSKHLAGLVALLLALALAAGLALPAALGAAGGTSMAYEEAVFGQELLTVDLVIDGDDWNDLLQNAIDEEYYRCTAVINGEKYGNVGIRAKGNTSLSQVYTSDSDRYSFKLKFDAYNAGGNCRGLSMLVLNNLMSDASYLKEYLTYDMFAYLGADASLYTMAQVTVNGEPWGVYLALEPVDETMLERLYGADFGELYKPDTLDMGGGGPGAEGKDFDPSERRGGSRFSPDGMREDTQPEGFPALAGGGEGSAPETGAAPDGGAPEGMPQMPDDQGGMGGFGSSAGGSTLNYTDDDLDSYTDIWDGAKTDSTDADHRRVVEALQNICEQTDLEDYMDVDNMLRYMAVQTFVVNLDSLTGTMAHNYYLYEEDGRLNLLPWDYNLAFGGFQSGDASSMVNFPIDTPFTSSLEDRAFFAGLLENEAYREQYHAYLRELCEGYVQNVFPQTYAALRVLLDNLVASEEADPTAFFTNEEYRAGAEMLRATVERRAESILGQLDGAIPATSDGQKENPDALLDCSDIDLSVMGSQNGGGHGSFGEGRERGRTDSQPEAGAGSAAPALGGAPERKAAAELAAADAPDETGAAEPPTESGADGPQLPADAPREETRAADAPGDGRGGAMQADGQPQTPDSMRPEGAEQGGFSLAGLALTGGCLAVLVLALAVVKRFHRRKFRTK